MDASKLTTKSQEALADAIRRAVRSGNPHLEPVHLLQALLEQDDGVAAPLLDAVGVDRNTVAAEADALLHQLPSASGETVASPEASRATLAVLNAAGDRARAMGDEFVATEHLLVGLAQAGGPTADLLRSAGTSPEELLEAFPKVRGSARVTSADPEGTYQALQKYGVDLTERARDGELDPVIGATPRSDGSCRCCRDARRTTPCSSASPAWARPPLWKASRSASSPGRP